MVSLVEKYTPKTRKQYFIWSGALLILSYALGSRAIDTGSLGQYTLTIILFYFCIHYLLQGLRNTTDVKRR